jgi:hypothetical protein
MTNPDSIYSDRHWYAVVTANGIIVWGQYGMAIYADKERAETIMRETQEFAGESATYRVEPVTIRAVT